MKIAVTSTGPSLDAPVEPRFGRCPWFLVGETDTMQFGTVENSSAALGAGIQTGQTMAKLGVTHVPPAIADPTPFRRSPPQGCRVTGCSGMVRDAIERFRSGSMTASAGANVMHYGMGGTGGNDMSRGGGHGMGGGRGMGELGVAWVAVAVWEWAAVAVVVDAA